LNTKFYERSVSSSSWIQTNLEASELGQKWTWLYRLHHWD